MKFLGKGLEKGFLMKEVEILRKKREGWRRGAGENATILVGGWGATEVIFKM
jgi:hypothetical protein